MIYESNYSVGSALNGDSLMHGNYSDNAYWATSIDNSNDALSHHGVPNQRWGVRHGPPYPVQRGREVRYSVGKMTEKTKSGLQKAGKITSSGAKAVGNAAKSVGSKVKSSFQNWKESKKADLAVKPTNNALMKNWQKKQLRISDMTNQELQQRIDRKRLEESYKHALRGDFSDPKTWSAKASSGKNNAKGKEAADSVLRKFGNAAVDGIAKGLTNKIEQTMTAKAKAKVARREARRDAIAEVMRDAAKERAEYKAERKNEAWRQRQERREQNRQNRRARNASYGDGAMDASYESRRYNYAGLNSGNEYYANPDEWDIH